MTYVIYIDESYDKKTKYTIMAGFIVPLSGWKDLNTKLQQLKLKYFSKTSINLKAIRRKKYDKEGLWSRLTPEQKRRFNEDFYNIISQKDNLIIAGIINNQEMDDKNKKLFFYLAYGFIIQRYQYFLSDNNTQGLVIMDSAEASEEVKNLSTIHDSFQIEGVPVNRNDGTLKIGQKEIKIKDYKRQKIDNICENLIFLDDEHNHLLQVSDMIAAAIFCDLNRSNDAWFNKIKKIIRSSKTGQISGYGMKFFPKR